MAFIFPQVQDFKNYFVRDFPYGTDPALAILDEDIAKALQVTNINFNQDFFGDQASFNVGYLLLAAHYLVIDIRNSGQGINGQFNFLQQSKGAGPVSESFGIPQRILDNPEFSMLCKTNYGARFLLLILPQLSGQIFAVGEMTKP